jgi:hypothetical protein
VFVQVRAAIRTAIRTTWVAALAAPAPAVCSVLGPVVVARWLSCRLSDRAFSGEHGRLESCSVDTYSCIRPKDIIRCLKRLIAREIYYALHTRPHPTELDLAA